jgi:hypothetical protein
MYGCINVSIDGWIHACYCAGFNPSIDFLKGVVDRALADFFKLGDLRDAEGLAQLFDFHGFEFFGSLLPALIDAALLRKGEAGGLAFFIVLKFNLPETEMVYPAIDSTDLDVYGPARDGKTAVSC